MMYYALKSALVLTILYGGFSALLSHETFHRFNRVLLLGIVVLSMMLPAVHITTENPAPIVLEQYWVENTMPAVENPTIEETTATAEETAVYPQTPASNLLKEENLWDTIYLIGLFVALVCFVRRGILLFSSLRGGLRLPDKQGNTIVVKGGAMPPFSFMHWIVMNVDDYEQHRRSILTHEQAHARLGHSWDVLLLEIIQVIQWFNPFAWLLARELKAIHEYEADEAVICQGIDAKQYQQLLVIKAVGNRLQLLANTLNRGSLKKRINMMQQQKSNRWRMLRAAFAIPVAALAVMAFATPDSKTNEVQQANLNNNIEKTAAKPLVEYKTNDKVGKNYRDYYRVNFGEGVWIENNGASHIEEQYFTYSFNNSLNGKTSNMVTMMLNGVPFDQDHLPKLSSNDLKKMEIKEATVNLITTPVTIPASVEGNVPRVQTLLLPGKGQLYIKNGKATPGDWMHCSITDWEPTAYNYSVRNEFERSKTKPGFKCWIYASKETAEKDVSRAEALMRELGITNYEVVRNLPKKHFTDSELRQWAQAEKEKGTAYDKLYDAMAPNHMDCADVHRQWHIVKAVYGRK